MSKLESKNDNQFGLGLILGFLAGSTGYFLFTSEQGKEFKEKLKTIWEELQQQLPATQELKIGELKVSELVSIVLNGTDPQEAKTKRGAIIKDANRPAVRSLNLKPKKFKGL